jgi:hypothetical protein
MKQKAGVKQSRQRYSNAGLGSGWLFISQTAFCFVSFSTQSSCPLLALASHAFLDLHVSMARL